MKTTPESIRLPLVRKRKSHYLGRDWRTQMELQLMIWPAIVLISIFSFFPLFGLLMAFKSYDPMSGVKGIFTSEWNNFENFTVVFQSFQFWPMLKNTVGINLFGSLIGLPVTLLFALMLNELTSRKFKSFLQTITYLPHFLSWVIYGGLFITLLNPQGGIVNELLMQLHLIDKPIQFLGDPRLFLGSCYWHRFIEGFGLGGHLISGCHRRCRPIAYMRPPPSMEQGVSGRMLMLRFPCIKPTVMILIIFAISGMLNNNFTQIYVFQNTLNMPASQVIDTYLYQTGLLQFPICYGDGYRLDEVGACVASAVRRQLCI